MPVPNRMQDLSTLASSNYPTGTEAIGNSLDNYLRSHAAIIRSTNSVASSSIAAASTTDISSSDGEAVTVTGSATINSLGSGFPGCYREVNFTGSCSVVNSSNIILPNSANVTTSPGDIHGYRCASSGVWRLTSTSRVGIGNISGLQDSLDQKVGRTGGQTMIGASLYLSYTAPLGAPPGSISTVLTNQISTGNLDEIQFSAIRRSSGSDWSTASQRMARVIDGVSTQGFVEFNGGVSPNAVTLGVGSTNICWAARNGDFTAAGNLESLSDERLKSDWRGLGDIVSGLAGVKRGAYTRKDTGASQVGVSAQSLKRVMPLAVGSDESGTLSVAYGNAALVGVCELASRLIALEGIVLGKGAK